MLVRKKEASILRKAMAQWQKDDLLPPETAKILENSLEVMPFDWKRLAKYSFWLSVACIVTTLSALLADDVLMAWLGHLFEMSHGLQSASMALVAAALYGVGYRMRVMRPERVFSNEAVLFLGVLATAGAVSLLGLALSTGDDNASPLILLSCVIYGVIGYAFRSNLVWVFALLSLGGWMGAETGYVSGWGSYYLGLNYPLRFVLFGLVLTGGALVLERQPRFDVLKTATLAVGLLYLFVSLWILSIFGNYGDMDQWDQVKQIELLHWSVLFALAAGGAIYYGIRFEHGMVKGYGLTFLFLNLYTRYFEFFWDALHKAVFFAVLAASFWFLGRKAEAIWAFRSPKPVLSEE